MSTIYAVTLRVYDPSMASERTLFYSTTGFTTRPTDTPPNTTFVECVRRPPQLKRSLFRDQATFGRSLESSGFLMLNNGDGALDGLRAYGFDGRDLTLYEGETGAAFSTFTQRLVATMESVEVGRELVTVWLRDRMLDLSVPLQGTKYAGDNSLPDGLEGTEDDLKDKPKPLCFGTVRNVPAVCVNTSKLVYQVNDGPVQAVNAVYDAGVALGTIGAWNTDSLGFYVHDLWYDGTNYIAVGEDPGGVGNCFTSPDFAAWTSRNAQFGGDVIYGIADDGAGTLVIVGTSGKISTSTDNGATWTAQVSGTANNLYAVCYNADGDVFLAGGQDNAVVYSDDSGATWSAATTGLTATTDLYGAAYGNGYYVLVGNTAEVATSTNLTIWEVIPFPAGTLNHLEFGNGKFVATGSAGVVAASSGTAFGFVLVSDGITASRNYQGVAYSPTDDLWMMVGYDGGNSYVAWSRNTTTWAEMAVAPIAHPWGAQYVNSQFLMCSATDGTVAAGASAEYASEADLLDDDQAPAPGSAISWLDGGMFRLGATPAGTITADVTQGDAAADRTHAEAFRWALTRQGYPLAQWNEDDLTALDTAIDDVTGLWIGPDDNPTVAGTVDRIAQSAGAWWGQDNDGILRIKQFTAPSGSAVATLTENDIISLGRVQPNDAGRGLPSWRSILRYQRNHTVQMGDLAGGVSDARRAFLAREYREAKYEDATVQVAHLLAPEIIEECLIDASADAIAEATRRQALRGTDRDVFEIEVGRERAAGVDLGDVVTVTHSRFGLSAGVDFRVIGHEDRYTPAAAGALAITTSLTLWK